MYIPAVSTGPSLSSNGNSKIAPNFKGMCIILSGIAATSADGLGQDPIGIVTMGFDVAHLDYIHIITISTITGSTADRKVET